MECIGSLTVVDSSAPTMDMIFNPIPELELLAITYNDGVLAICNPCTLETRTWLDTGMMQLMSLAASSDGRVLAGAGRNGDTHLFLFETLQPIYRIARPDSQLIIGGLAFSSDNLRLFDIHGQYCNVWEPYVLIPRDGGDDTSSEPYSEVSILGTPAPRAHVFRRGGSITVIEVALHGKVLFVGRQDGSIDICELSTGEVVETIRLYDPFAVHHLEWNEEKSYLLSFNTDRYMVHSLSTFGKTGSKAKMTILLDGYERYDNVRQALLSPGGTSVLLCTDSNVKLIGLGGKVLAEEAGLARSWWIRHPSNSSYLMAIQNGAAHLVDWNSLELLTSLGSVMIQPSSPKPLRIARATALVAALGLFEQSQPKLNNLVTSDATKLDGTAKSVSSEVLNGHVDHLNIQQFIGFLGSSLFFLDAGGWVCSINRKNLKEATHYIRHFFIPLTWRDGSEAVIKIVSETALAFGRGEQLIVFHGFLDFEEKVPF